MAAENDVDLSTLKSQLNLTQEVWKQEVERGQSQVEALQAKLMQVKACIQGSEEDAKQELEVLWRRVKTTATLLTYLKSKARIIAVPQLAHMSCGIERLEGVGFIDKNGTPLSGWSRNIDLSSYDGPEKETWLGISRQHGLLDEKDAAYTGEVLKSVQMVTDVMEALIKRAIMAESETAIEKEKVTLGQEEIKKKSIQIENMSLKLEEMEHFALGTNSILNEMRQRVEDLVEETSRQRERATENEQELCRVKRDFESLKSYVSSLITVRETLLSSEKQFQTIERLFERKQGENQPEDGASPAKPPRIKIGKSSEDSDKKGAHRRVKDVEICVPIVYGTIAFYLGRKASESQSHKWTVYVRGATNEDLGVVIKRVVFQLHPSFNNPTRVLESPPFELSECGWGEFEIGISLFFHNDICDKQLDLFHHLKLYPEDESGPQTTKKPVVVESYNEIVYPDPSENFLARVQNHPAVIVPRMPAGFNLPYPVSIESVNEREKGDTKDHPLNQWFMNFSEADELLKLAAARQQITKAKL